jgi:integrase/recombinase XerC
MRVRGCSPETIRTHRSALEILQRDAGRPLLELTGKEIYAWQVARSAQVVADTVRNNLTYAALFFRWAEREGLITGNPCIKIVLPKKPVRLPRPIPQERLDRALSVARADLRAILCLATYAGLRAAEVAGLDWADVDLTRRRLRIIGKGNRERSVPIAALLLEALTALPHRTGPVIARLDGEPGTYRANALSSRVGRYLGALGIPDGLHSCRHYFGTELYRSTRDIRLVQRAMGHSSIINTEKYVALVDDEVFSAVLAAFDGAGAR